ncbi:putative protein kinase [Plasmopara halstedii]
MQAVLLVLLALVITLQDVSSINIPVDTTFEFSGLHSDFAQQFYVLYTELDNTAQLSNINADTLPHELVMLLSINSLLWSDLPGLLQRAVLWDAGYVLTPTYTVAKVYTRCGRSMAELVVPPKALKRAGCELQECMLEDGTQFYQALNCNAFKLYRAVQCAVDTMDDTSAPEYATVWRNGGKANMLPEVTVQRHAYTDFNGAPNLIFALHTTKKEASYAQCPFTPAMVIPCAPYNLVNQSKFCTPNAGKIASTWLLKHAADHHHTKTWLLVPLCIFTFVTFGVVAVYRYKSALRGEAQQEMDLYMRENQHLFDNGAVEAFLVPKYKQSNPSRTSQPSKTSQQQFLSNSSFSIESDRSSSAQFSQDESKKILSSDQGEKNAAAFDHFDSTIGLSASSFDPLVSNARMQPLRKGTVLNEHGTEKVSTLDNVTARKNEMAIRSLRIFESHRKIRRLRVPMSELQVLRPLSRGSTGEIWLARHRNTQVALKQLIPEKRRLLHEMEMFLAEIYLLAQLKHPHIVMLNGIAWNTLGHVVMVQELLEAGDLQRFLAHQRTITATAQVNSKCSISTRLSSVSRGSLQIDRSGMPSASSPSNGGCDYGSVHLIHTNHFTWSKHKLTIAQAITSALTYLHALSPMVLHRDVKSRNVLLSSSLDAKLCDFGISRRKSNGNENDKRVTGVAGTLSWTAPELLLGEEYNEKIDIYSLGILFSELDTCTLPYHDPVSLAERLVQHPLCLMRRIINDGLRPQLSTDCPLPITHLIAACLARDPKLRPSAADVGAWLASARGERLLRKSFSVLNSSN